MMFLVLPGFTKGALGMGVRLAVASFDNWAVIGKVSFLVLPAFTGRQLAGRNREKRRVFRKGWSDISVFPFRPAGRRTIQASGLCYPGFTWFYPNLGLMATAGTPGQ